MTRTLRRAKELAFLFRLGSVSLRPLLSVFRFLISSLLSLEWRFEL